MNRLDTQLNVPRYDAPDSDDSDNSEEYLFSSKEPSTTINVEEYEEDDESNNHFSQEFQPRLNQNIFLIEPENDTLLIGLKEKQRIFISGIFRLKIVKGGTVYNNVHYNASHDYFTMWHPLSNSIPAIQSSHYAGWNENFHIDAKNKEIVTNDLKEYPCVIRVQNAFVEGLLKASGLYTEVRYLWKIRDSLQSFTSANCCYHILSESFDHFEPLQISDEWLTNIEKLTMIHKNSPQDMRVIVLGGKNAGKSTFLRLLIENFMHGGSHENSEEMLYLDLDPGQPEYSDPECISLNRITSCSKVMGKHLGQSYRDILKQCYLGANSPQDIPNDYLESVNELVEYLEDQNYVGTSLINLPGWIKGFGLNILNYVIARYKPTNIIILESRSSKQYFEELKIDSQFTNFSGNSYKPALTKINANSSNPENLKFQAFQLRNFRTLVYFHTVIKNERRLKYDFKALIERPPFQMSFGSHGIRGIQFFEEFRDLIEEDIKVALEGTIVGLHVSKDIPKDRISFKGSFPMVRKGLKNLKFVSLALIHSIDAKNRLMNIYIPEFLTEKLDSDPQIKWVLLRGKSETPLCELCPPDTVSSSRQIPYISIEPRKKYEHVWKVRKNVLRRGHHMK